MLQAITAFTPIDGEIVVSQAHGASGSWLRSSLGITHVTSGGSLPLWDDNTFLTPLTSFRRPGSQPVGLIGAWRRSVGCWQCPELRKTVYKCALSSSGSCHLICRTLRSEPSSAHVRVCLSRAQRPESVQANLLWLSLTSTLRCVRITVSCNSHRF